MSYNNNANAEADSRTTTPYVNNDNRASSNDKISLMKEVERLKAKLNALVTAAEAAVEEAGVSSMQMQRDYQEELQSKDEQCCRLEDELAEVGMK